MVAKVKGRVRPRTKRAVVTGSPRKSRTPRQTPEQKALTKGMRALFAQLGFKRVSTDRKQIEFHGRVGELDDMFLYENIVVLAEYTVESNSAHLLKKKPLYDYILDDSAGFVEYAIAQYPEFATYAEQMSVRGFEAEHYRIRIVYAPLEDASEQLVGVCPRLNFLYGSTTKYFQALAKTIEQSARNEFCKFLGLQFDEVGDIVYQGVSHSPVYEGYLLPETNSSYPKGYKVVSFYADPGNLISKSYVLRRDGWRDEDHLYQRILIGKKIRAMRRYLATESRVFVNNVIVTLPDGTTLNDQLSKAKNLASDQLGKVKAVTIVIPAGFDTVGVVDGQHRIFCYHEGTDKDESFIKPLRARQNLLVTGIIYPHGTAESTRRTFEARLFLEINDNQARARSALKQDIEVIIRPASTTAIAKRVIQRLGKSGPYKDKLQTNYFDPPTKIKTSSIVSYGLKPLVKLDGTDSLFYAWSHPEKAKLKGGADSIPAILLDQYVDFCVEKINEFMLQVKLKMVTQLGSWRLEDKPRSALLTTTAINGMIVCMRRLISAGYDLSESGHKKRLKDVANFPFASFKSSQWQRLGTQLFESHYKK